ncbi:unnamed protein product [Coffea canephora]|uniref:Uncharacterized protein n=1 Tax=Coffea canephora TaxID=49390 RepID=A0A068US16_COFCA|nr:unnamed protein product [Coffea canephora]
MGTEAVISQLKILMFPWLAYCHIWPTLELAKRLADRGFAMYICSTSSILDSSRKSSADYTL